MDDYQSAFLEATRHMVHVSSSTSLPFVIGRDENNAPVTKDLAALPHLVIAGATGTGKSTLAHAILLSLIGNTPPEKLSLILCDTKVVELSAYNGIAHLLLPVVTEPAKVSSAVSWTANEAVRRLEILSKGGFRSLDAHNSYAISTNKPALPHILLVIDDVADAINSNEAWSSLQRIAQCGRAVGIHLILVTQNVSNKNLAPILSSAISARAVFNVFSNTDERLLLGSGKNTFLSDVGEIIYCTIPARSKERICCYPITDKDINAILSQTRKQPPINTSIPEIVEAPDGPEVLPVELECDEMLPAAVEVILETGQASVSMLQRRLKLGYARAARILDEMEDKGIVGPFQGSKPRSILITKEQWHQVQCCEQIQEVSVFPKTAQIYAKQNRVKSQPKRWYDSVIDTFSSKRPGLQPQKNSFQELLDHATIFTGQDEFNQFLTEHPQIDEIRTKVVGSSFSNDDGSSRQQAMSHCRDRDPVLFHPYLYQGAPAIAVYSEHGQLGHLSADLAANIEYDYGTDVILSGVISEVTGGHDGLSYGCNLSIRVYKA